MLDVQHLDLGTHQVDMTGDDVKTLDVRGVHGFTDIHMVDDTFIQTALYIFYVHTQAARGIGLWVCINNQNGLFQGGKRCRQVDRGGSLTYTTFLIGQSYNLSHNINVYLLL